MVSIWRTAAVTLFLLLMGPQARLHEAPELCCGWELATPLLADITDPREVNISFVLALRERNMDEIGRIVRSVSDPRSARYGKYLAATEIASLSAPNPESVQVVLDWLLQHAVSFKQTVANSVVVSCRIHEAERLLATSFRLLRNPVTGQHSLRASAYELPDTVDDVVATVFGLHGLPVRRVKAKQRITEAGPAPVTPEVLASTYGIGSIFPTGSTHNRQQVTLFQPEQENNTDLSTFFRKFVPDTKPGDAQVFKFVRSDGMHFGSHEASLDIQYIMGVAPHVKTEFWQFEGSDFCLDLKNFTDMVVGDDAAPWVHSMSYGPQQNVTGYAGCDMDQVQVVESGVNSR